MARDAGISRETAHKRLRAGRAKKSVETRHPGKGRKRYRVRWRENGHNRAKVFTVKADADLFDAEVTRQRLSGESLAFQSSKETLDEFAVEWLGVVVVPNRAKATADAYATLYTRISPPHSQASGFAT
jgi:hypothetical protein